MNQSDDPTIDGIARRTFLKGGALLGATALLASSTASANHTPDHVVSLAAELEGPLTSVDETTNRIEVMGIPVDVSNAPIASATAPLELSQLKGESLPGRTQSGFLGGTATVVGTTPSTGGVIEASSVFAGIAENVILGAVTENTIPGETFESVTDPATQRFVVQGVEIQPVGDPRLPFSAGKLGMAVDMSTIPEGGLASPEGHIGNDGVLYAHTLELEGAGVELLNPNAVSITRVRCQDNDEIRVSGGSGVPGVITIYDDGSGDVLGTANAVFDAEAGVAAYDFRQEISACPMVVRVENEAGSTATFDVATGTPVPDEEPGADEPPEDPGATSHKLSIQGSGERAMYAFSVSGEVTGESLTSEDAIIEGGSAVIGAVGPGMDRYTFTGTLDNFVLNGDPAATTVMLDDAPYPIDRPFPNANVLTLRGNDNRAEYSFTVSGDLDGASLTPEDDITGSSATGAVRRGQDSYYYTGDLTEFEFTQGIATVIRNGQVVTNDPTQP